LWLIYGRKISWMKQFLLLLIIAFSFSLLKAQDKTGVIKKIVQAQEYVFTPQTAHPIAMRTINLSSGFDLQISKDSIIAYLPYYGRANSAPLSPNETGGITFTSTKFQYAITLAKNGGWDVLIKPEDVTEIRMINLSISEEGYTTVYVTSNSRQAISFNGRISAR
jgi:Domain of unknown function (DUF4251)